MSVGWGGGGWGWVGRVSMGMMYYKCYPLLCTFITPTDRRVTLHPRAEAPPPIPIHVNSCSVDVLFMFLHFMFVPVPLIFY